MTKAELLADIAAKSLKVVAVAEEVDAVKNAAGVRQYMANVMEQRADSVQGRNIGFYVINEGEAGEAAYYRDVVTPKNAARTLVEAYLETKRPATFLWYQILDVNEDQRVAKVKVIDVADMKEKYIAVYKIGTNPVTHAVITTA